MPKIKHYPIKIQVGSNYFFNGYYDDFKPHDNDFIEIIRDDDKMPIYSWYHDNNTSTCHFMYKDVDRAKLLKYSVLNPNIQDRFIMASLSVKKFNEHFGITIPILKAIRHKIRILSDKHDYVIKAIDYYIENESFTLTKQQRDELYRMYKKSRGLC